MRPATAVAAATTAVIVVATLATGPLVGYSLTAPDPFDPGSGSVDATVIDAPGSATIAPASHGGDVRHLRADPVRVDVSGVVGQPTLVYEIDVPAIGHSSASLVFLDAEMTGELELSFRPSTLEPDRLERGGSGDGQTESGTDRGEFDGVLRVLVVDDGGERTIHEASVAVEVAE